MFARNVRTTHTHTGYFRRHQRTAGLIYYEYISMELPMSTCAPGVLYICPFGFLLDDALRPTARVAWQQCQQNWLVTLVDKVRLVGTGRKYDGQKRCSNRKSRTGRSDTCSSDMKLAGSDSQGKCTECEATVAKVLKDLKHSGEARGTEESGLKFRRKLFREDTTRQGLGGGILDAITNVYPQLKRLRPANPPPSICPPTILPLECYVQIRMLCSDTFHGSGRPQDSPFVHLW
ncbi:hypothetical protein DFJ77DRAFT_168208 [Powellomyces hirtus]|nr:hypothetical protein DFJ77DRAFT_168208 [Powellomyces hirtus]